MVRIGRVFMLSEPLNGSRKKWLRGNLMDEDKFNLEKDVFYPYVTKKLVFNKKVIGTFKRLPFPK